jgi:hypothetical protein
MQLFSHRSEPAAIAPGVRLKPRKPFHPHELKPSGITGYSLKRIAHPII